MTQEKYIKVTFEDSDDYDSDQGQWEVKIPINEETFNDLVEAINQGSDEREEIIAAIVSDWQSSNMAYSWKLIK
ncbi:hypothetical protein [Nostoc sp. ATCC 53789]|uniref:hypothetical protein n=1 Tax=Nostoc sp. ATCC 53789 TaxID=76335 RepID=UPI000DECCC4A|nr:hypothetical protein [Nostoc sp. ATCC 53789]QHG15793.1 hypothetical protein GJB62_07300 [Nostoc sp. ATCC 53789]RCJ27768.1 hypothetical protein A6V25_17870 [Nostoc sp. ATCC 53789]